MGRGRRDGAAGLHVPAQDRDEGDGPDGRLASALDGEPAERRAAAAPGAGFGYLFRYAPDADPSPDAVGRLETLALAMTESECDPRESSGSLPPVWTYFGQFLEHDMSAAALRVLPAAESARIAMQGATPRSRELVEDRFVNLRDGALRLDSLYGADAGHGPLAGKLARLMREPGSTSRMRIDVPEASPLGRVARPADRGADLPRLGRLLSDDPALGVTTGEIMALPPELRRSFLRDGRLNPARAMIGDARNDSSLQLAQLHLAFLRFHNAIADWLADTGGAQPEMLFDTSRRLMRWHLQWLTLNVYLPRICDPVVLGRVRRAAAPVYTEFANASRSGDAGRQPIPLEFWAAASRHRFSMIRGAYDLNRHHGRGEVEGAPSPRAGLDFLQASTGAGLEGARLPEDRVLDWERFAIDPPRHADRAARRIDTWLSPDEARHGAFAALASRTLLRAHAINLPAAQDCVGELNQVYDGLIRPLSEAELCSGHTGEAVADGLQHRTPLWFYILKEAEVQTGGERLGQLGSALVAETLIGVIARDPFSLWGRPGPGGGPWVPAQGARPGGLVIDGIEPLLKAAELL